MTFRLVTIGFSHFCEKARWALDRAGIDYSEESHAPLFHAVPALLAGGKRTVPILCDTETKQVLRTSTDILVEIDRRVPSAGLYPRDPDQRREVEELVARFDRVLGPAARRIAWYFMMHGGEAYARELVVSSAPAQTRIAAHVAFPVILAAVRRGVKVDDERFARSRSKLHELYAFVSERLEARRREGASWLVGDAFSAADLTFAALSVPVLAAEGSGFAFPPRALLHPEHLALAERLAATPAGAHALHTLAAERRRTLIA